MEASQQSWVQRQSQKNNTSGGIHFDSTVDVFDAEVLGEYIDGTDNRGGPLVTSFNVRPGVIFDYMRVIIMPQCSSFEDRGSVF